MRRSAILISTIALLLLASLASAQDGGRSSVANGYDTATDGTRLYYEKLGTGSKVIILPLRSFTFRDFSRLADKYTVIAYDNRNRGRSDRITDPTRISLHHDVEDIESVRKHFGVNAVNLAGYSYMGKVIVMYALKYPRNVASLVQIGPVGIKLGTEYPKHLTANDPAPVIDAAGRAKLEEMRKNGEHQSRPAEYCELDWSISRYGLVGDPKNVDLLGPGPCSMPNEHPANLANHFGPLLKSDLSIEIPKGDIARLAVPVLTIHGTRDRNAPYGAGREWASILPNARLLTIQGGAHQVFSEFPDIVFAGIRAFLEGKDLPTFEKLSTGVGPKE